MYMYIYMYIQGGVHYQSLHGWRLHSRLCFRNSIIHDDREYHHVDDHGYDIDNLCQHGQPDPAHGSPGQLYGTGVVPHVIVILCLSSAEWKGG